MKRVLTALLILFSAANAAAGQDAWTERELMLVRSLALSELAAPPAAPSNRVADDPAARELGRQLFFDPRFSLDGTVSCATCHIPQHGFQDGRTVARGIGTSTRRTMPLAGAAYSPFLFWDGRADRLWSQALGPLESAEEHGGGRTRYAHIIARSYKNRYEATFGPLPPLSHLPSRAGPVPDPDASAAWSAMLPEDRKAVTTIFVNIGKVIAAFERTLRPPVTRFDAWVYSDAFPLPGALNLQEVEGLRLFVGRAGCINCHNGSLMTNHTFHNTGVPPGPVSDFGRAKGARMVVLSRFNCRGPFSDAGAGGCPELRFLSNKGHLTEGAFKTPGLRGVAQRPPYMHAGQFETLAEVLDHYSTAPQSVIGHSELLPLDLSQDEKRALEAFLVTLSP